jgi:hypothetical protein
MEWIETWSLWAMPGTVIRRMRPATASGRGRRHTVRAPWTARIESGRASPWKEWYGKVPSGRR